jgi:hypothetical protein
LKSQTIRERLLASTMIGGVMLAAAVAVPAVTVIVAPTSATAQDFSTGSLAGTVTDSTGAPVAGASVAVRSNEQGFTRNITTGRPDGLGRPRRHELVRLRSRRRRLGRRRFG